MGNSYNNFSEFSADYSYDEISDKLGEGGFATVYKADDLLRSRKVAIKVAKVPKNEKYSLMHEYEIVKTLPVHKNIVYYESCYRFKLHGLGNYDFAVMDYYQEGNFDEFMNKRKLMPDEFSTIVEDILLGIEFLHQNKIIHRDIKPANILITTQKEKYVSKIADFGLGKIKKSIDESFTENSIVGGTLNYAAPEQILGRKVKPNIDLWSFGVLLYKMCTEEVPFNVADTNTTDRREELTRKIIQVELPSSVNQIEEPYQTIIQRCLVSDAEKRAKTASELISILRLVAPPKAANFIEPTHDKAPKPEPLPINQQKGLIDAVPAPVIGKVPAQFGKTKNFFIAKLKSILIGLSYNALGGLLIVIVSYFIYNYFTAEPKVIVPPKISLTPAVPIKKDTTKKNTPGKDTLKGNDTLNIELNKKNDSIFHLKPKKPVKTPWGYLILERRNRAYHLVNKSGEEKLPFRFHEIENFDDGRTFFWIKEGKKYGFILLTKKGVKYIKPQYSMILDTDSKTRTVIVKVANQRKTIRLDDEFKGSKLY